MSERELLRRSLFLLKTQLKARSGESINLISKIEDYLKRPDPVICDSCKAIRAAYKIGKESNENQ